MSNDPIVYRSQIKRENNKVKDRAVKIDRAIATIKNMIVSTNHVDMKIIVKYQISNQLPSSAYTYPYGTRLLTAWFLRKVPAWGRVLLTPFKDFLQAFSYYIQYKNIDTTVRFDPNTKKIYCNTPPSFEVRISTAAPHIHPEKELVAIILHEFGHNFYYKNMCIHHALLGMEGIIGFSTGLYILKRLFIDNEQPSKLTAALCCICVTILFFKFAQLYYTREAEMDADSFAIKCGYGKYLATAFKRDRGLIEYINDQLPYQTKSLRDKISIMTTKFIDMLRPFKYHGSTVDDLTNRINSINQNEKEMSLVKHPNLAIV